MPAVEFHDIVKSHGAVTVLDKLDLKIESGEFIVLLGPSGCGKTTLLNLLAGLLDVTSGRITIGGRDVTDLDPKDRGLAMVFQSYALYPVKTVRGNLAFGLSSRKLPASEIERRIAWAAKLLKIEHLMDRKPGELSGGQRQRVAIGRALVKQVEVLLFDEPLSNLDAKLRTEMRIEIKKLHGELGNTVVFVTHDQVEAMTLATRIAVMNKGVIQQIGTPDEIYETPETLFVADFIGSPSMNMLDATLSVNGAVTAVDAVNGLEVDLSGYSFRAPPEAGRPVKLGIRPEHVRTAPPGGGRDDLPVVHFEKTGADAIAFLRLPGGTLAARIDPQLAGGGVTRIAASLSGERASLFDPQTGRRL